MAAPDTTGAVARLFPRPASDWQHDALCAQTDPELFFPSDGVSHAQIARRICTQCPVRTECLQDALADRTVDDEFGIRAGIGPKKRAAMRRAAAKQQKAAA
jgi:WhiB family transcriptional regulator, redox-sensing transcriptional regulator